MNFVGAIGTVAALANYRKAKSEYEALKEQQNGLVAAVQAYNSSKYDEYIAHQKVDNVDFMPGVRMTTIVRVGNLVGKLFRIQVSVVLSNTSSEKYHIYRVAADCEVLNLPIRVFSAGIKFEDFSLKADSALIPQQKAVNKDLHPGETMEIKLPAGVSALVDPETGENKTGELRNLICQACNRKLITSCWKISIEDAETANILVSWGDDKHAKSNNVPGVLRYCMEAFYPKD